MELFIENVYCPVQKKNKVFYIHSMVKSSEISVRQTCKNASFNTVFRHKSIFIEVSHIVTKPTKWHVRSAKTQINLGIRQDWSESLLCTQWVAKDPSFLDAESEDSDQTGRMPRLIWDFGGRTCHFVGFVMLRLILLLLLLLFFSNFTSFPDLLITSSDIF